MKLRAMVTNVSRGTHELTRIDSRHELGFIPGEVEIELRVVFCDGTLADVDEMIEKRVVFDLVRSDRVGE